MNLITHPPAAEHIMYAARMRIDLSIIRKFYDPSCKGKCLDTT